MSPDTQSAAVPRVLIASASVGAGHNQAAKAVAEGLRAAMPHAAVEVADVLTFTPWSFRAYYAGGYSLAVTKLPCLYGVGFWLSDRPNGPRRGPGERLRLWREGLHLRRFGRFVRDWRPDLIVDTHFLAAPYLARLAREGVLSTPQMVVVTDILVHRFWYSEGVEHWFVPAEPTAQRLRQWGVEPQRITVSGMPIHPKWTASVDRKQALADWRLPEGRPVVLLAGGAEFTCGPVVEIARRIAGCGRGAFVAVLAGRNKDLLGRLARLPEAGRDVVGIPFTDRVHELVHVCSLMVTKAGGLSTAECIARGTPMVIMKPVPGQEAGNAAYFAERGAATIARDAQDAVAQAARLLADADARRRMSEAARSLYRPGRETIVEAVRRALDRPGERKPQQPR